MLDFMKTILNAFKAYVDKKIKTSIADWNQTDESALNFIKNRPFYESNKIFEIINQSIDFSESEEVNWGQTKVGYLYEYIDLSLSVGKEYQIIFDDVMYSSVCFIDNEFANVVIGNGTFVYDTNEDNGLPFAIGNYEKGETTAYIIVSDQESHTFSISTIERFVHQVDEKYLPDTIARTDDIKTVQTIAETAQITAETAQATAEIQPDWNQTDDTAVDYIKNNPINLKWETITATIDESNLLNPSGELQAVLNDFQDRHFYKTDNMFFYSYNTRATVDQIEALLYSSNFIYAKKKDDNIYTYEQKNIDASQVVIRSNENKFDTSSYAIVYHNNVPVIIIVREEALSNGYACRAYLSYAENVEYVASFTYCSNLDTYEKMSLFPKYGGNNIVFEDDLIAANNSILNSIDELDQKILSVKKSLVLIDLIDGHEYIVTMQNGILTSQRNYDTIKIIQPPNKTDYTNTEKFDPTGMRAVAVSIDGIEHEVTNYTYNSYVTTGSSTHAIHYVDNGIESIAYVDIVTRTLEEALIDFTYTMNDDGTYTLNTWNGTYNGQPSTELIIPNSPLVIVEIE